jgi:hypothetical protein
LDPDFTARRQGFSAEASAIHSPLAPNFSAAVATSAVHEATDFVCHRRDAPPNSILLLILAIVIVVGAVWELFLSGWVSS